MVTGQGHKAAGTSHSLDYYPWLPPGPRLLLGPRGPGTRGLAIARFLPVKGCWASPFSSQLHSGYEMENLQQPSPHFLSPQQAGTQLWVGRWNRWQGLREVAAPHPRAHCRTEGGGDSESLGCLSPDQLGEPLGGRDSEQG